MNEIWIIGMGRFGQMATERLAKIHPRSHLVLVDPNGDHLQQGNGPHRTLVPMDGVSFLDQQLSLEKGPDWIIPALPVHLAAQWCLARLKKRGLNQIRIPSEIDGLVPNPMRDPSDQIYVSHADFICPDNCAEPTAICTVTQKKRQVDMFDLLGSIRISGWSSLVARSYQLAPGVGGYRPRRLFDLLYRVEKMKKNCLLSTACRCHGVITGLGYPRIGDGDGDHENILFTEG
jgi:hypothetical protein